MRKTEKICSRHFSDDRFCACGTGTGSTETRSPRRHADGRTHGNAVMLVVTIVASRWVVLHLLVPYVPSVRLGVGASALGLLLLAEFGFVLWVRGLSIRQYFAPRDRASGAVYYAMLGLFAIMPLLVARR